jgi:hypothetical protein
MTENTDFCMIVSLNFEQIIMWSFTLAGKSGWSRLGVMAVVTEIDVKGDSLLLWEWHSHGYDCTHACCVGFGLAGTDFLLGLRIHLSIERDNVVHCVRKSKEIVF